MALSVTEKITDNLVWTVLAIGAAGTVVTGVDTTSVTATGGGAYTGADFTIYRVRVTTAGASGAAKVTVTDMLHSDTPGGTTTVTSATPFALGALGITLTLTWTGTLAADDMWYVKSGAGSSTPAQAFTVDATWVTRTNRIPGRMQTAGPEIYVYEPDLDQEQDTTESVEPWCHYLIQGWTTAEPKEITNSTYETAEQASSSLAKDMEQAIMSDHGRGGNANTTRVNGLENQVSELMSNVIGIGLSVSCLTRHLRVDPTTST